MGSTTGTGSVRTHPLADTTVPDACSDTLTAGEVLLPGRQLECPTGEFSALMRGDGNLVVHRRGDRTPLWASGTDGHRDGFVEMRDDGDAVICDGTGAALWSFGTAGHPGAFVQLHDDGRLAIHDFYRELLWASRPAG